MKSISTIAIIGLLFFACKLCSTTGHRNHPVESSTPVPLMYARDLIKPQLGSYALIKSYTKEEARRTATGFTADLIDQSNDTAGGEYKSSGRSVALMACNYLNTYTPASLVDKIESGMRGSRVWKTIKTTPRNSGKQIEAEDQQGNAVVVWNNSYWVFITIGNPADAKSLADSVGF